jgi:hypothetical protein
MSANRSVQAAQRRQFKQEPISRVPQPSINSAQMFANQSRQGQGPNIPNGRLAGQQQQQMQMQQMQQMQMQQQQQMYQQSEQKDGLSGVSKLTLAQAITLITLRLGAVETKLLNTEHQSGDSSQFDHSLFDNILSRLDELEKRPQITQTEQQSSTQNVSNNSVLLADVNILKQQFEPVKQSAIQTKTAITSLTKDNKETKTQLEIVKTELQDTKNLVSHLQQMLVDMENRLLIGNVDEEQDQDQDQDAGYNYDETLIKSEEHLGSSIIDFNSINVNQDIDSNINVMYSDILETNLKEIIENEINLSQ